MRTPWAVLATGATVLSMSLLSGCAALGIPHRTPDPAPSPTPAAAPSVPSRLLPVADGTVAATGTFSGTVSGTVQIVRDGDSYRLDFVDLRLPDGRDYAVDLLSEPPSDTRCSGAYWAVGLGSVESSIDLHTELAVFFEDPSYLDGVQIQPNWDDHLENDCSGIGGYTITDYAKLRWSLPDLRPDLHPADSGPRPGAAGALKKGPTGILSQYWIESGDTYADIADRFGITTADLAYLNPVGWWQSRPDEIEAGCTLNVSKQARGATTRCTWQP